VTRVGREAGGPPAAVIASPSPRTTLGVRGLTVTFGAVRAVSGVDLAAEEGTIVGLVGPNGCGKTTTLRAVAGLVRPASGTVDVQGAAGGSLAARGRTAFVPDEPSGLDELVVAEYLELVAALWRADAGFARRAHVLLDAFELTGRRRTPLRALSHGQRRLVSVVGAVALDRPLLLFDEATAALDPEAVITLREVLVSVAARGGAVLLATQDLHFAESVCDRVTLLSAGRVVAEGSLDALSARFGAGSLEAIFVAALGTAERLESVRRALEAL
jgi:ABC-2 type transport system ATP-binding protein